MIGIFSFLFGRKKRKRNKGSDYNPPVLGTDSVNIEDGKIVIDSMLSTSDDDNVWNINSTGANIVSPVSSKVVSHQDDKKIIMERRKEEDRRKTEDRRTGEQERRKKKKFVFKERRKNEWSRRGDYDRRFNSNRRSDKTGSTKIIKQEKDVLKNKKIKNSAAIEYIDSNSIKNYDENEPTNQRIKITPQIHPQQSKSISIQSGREAEIIQRDVISLGEDQIFSEDENSINDGANKTEINLENGARIGYVYRHNTLEEGDGNNFIEIVDSGIDTANLYFVGKEIIFKHEEQSIALNIDKSSYETTNIIVNKNTNIHIDENSSGFIKIGSYRTFEH